MNASPSGSVPCAEMVSTGAELLNGRIVNLHARALGEALRGLGIPLVRDTTLVDDQAAIALAVADACRRAALVFVTGGLGPTSDDVTREAVADALRLRIAIHPEAEAHLRAWFARTGRPVNADALRQAMALEGATLLPNRAGLAPGQRLATPEGGLLFLLPGPPREFRAVLEDGVLPALRARFAGRQPLMEEITMFAGMGESDLQAWVNRQAVPPGLEIGYCASPGRVEFRLSAREESLRPQARALAAAARAAFPGQAYADRRAELEEVVAGLLRDRGETLAVAESCTGGLLGALLTAIPGSSAWFLGGVISYANESKIRDLAVRRETLETHGAVSEACAREMAAGARARFGSTHAVAVTGIAGPDGGSPEKPVGTVFIGIAGPGGVEASGRRHNGDRGTVREAACQRALILLWKHLGGGA